MKIVAIVVTYNRIELLKNCLSLLSELNQDIDIMVIDNCSDDGTKEYCNLKDDINYFRMDSNIGGAGGFNFGLKEAYKRGYDYYWLMDDDTFVNKDTLKHLLKAAEKLDNKFGFLSSVALWKDGSNCIMNYHQINKKWQTDKGLVAEGLLKIQAATFVSFFIRHEVIKEVGLPIKDYFIWGDDTEYSNRISLKYPSYMVAKSQVVHAMGKNEGSDLIDMNDKKRIDRMYYSIRNDICTYRRIGVRESVRYYLWIINQIIKIIFSKSSFKLYKIKTILKGLVRGLFFFPKIESV